jgi:hypothetical protein
MNALRTGLLSQTGVVNEAAIEKGKHQQSPVGAWRGVTSDHGRAEPFDKVGHLCVLQFFSGSR